MSRLPNVLPPLPEELERLARLMSAGMGRIGLHAFTPGERDLRVGAALFTRLARQYKLPVVSANLADGSGKLLFPASKMVTVAGVKLGVFGVTTADVADAKQWEEWKIRVLDAEQAGRREAQALRSQGAQLVIGLLHTATTQDAQKLAPLIPDMDFAVLGHVGQSTEEPLLAGHARLVEAFSQGKHIGRLDLHVIAGVMRFADRGKRAQTLTMRADHQRQLDDYRKKVATEKGGATEYFKKRIVDLEQAIQRDDESLRSMPKRLDGSWFENRLVPLDSGSAEHPAVAMLVNDYNAESQRRAAAGKIVGVKPRILNQPPPVPARPGAPTGAAASRPKAEEPLRYAGSFACQQCHESAMKAWGETRHAHAMDSLRRKRRDGDPSCVGCHVTGFMRAGGTTDVRVATARLREVGCEACHGPSADHVAAPSKANTKRHVDADVCLGCHTPDQTQGDFDYATFVKAVIAPGHGMK